MNNNRRRNYRSRPQKSNFRRRVGSLNSNGSTGLNNNGNSNFNRNQVELDLRLLTNYYKSIGYYDIKIDSNSAEFNQEGNIDLVYSIDAGERFVIEKISTNINDFTKFI